MNWETPFLSTHTAGLPATPWPVTSFLVTRGGGTNLEAAGVEEVVAEAGVRPQQVGLDALWRLHGHLGPVLQDVDRELGARHTRQPQAEVTVNLNKQGVRT